jgi:transcriptional regulator with XRE-family HTH domain
MEKLGDVIRRRCRELEFSQAELAELVGVHVRQIRRYERGEQQPVLGVAVRLAATLEITLDELAGIATERATLSGGWWAARQAVVDGRSIIATFPVTLTQHGSVIELEAPEIRGGWRGELRLWSGTTLTGWYSGAASARGTMFFVLHGDIAEGRWVSQALDGSIVSGHAALARTRAAAHGIAAHLSA